MRAPCWWLCFAETSRRQDSSAAADDQHHVGIEGISQADGDLCCQGDRVSMSDQVPGHDAKTVSTNGSTLLSLVSARSPGGQFLLDWRASLRAR